MIGPALTAKRAARVAAERVRLEVARKELSCGPLSLSHEASLWWSVPSP